MLEVGDLAPEFEIQVDDGSLFKLPEFRGRSVVVYFYPKDDTAGCTAEARDFTLAEKDLESSNAVVIGISPDSTESHKRFKAKHDLRLPLGADPERKVIGAYGVWVEKSMYGRKFMGVERATFLIAADGRIAKIWRKVRVRGHIASVVSTVRARAQSGTQP